MGFIKGADVSFLEQVEDGGGVHTEGGEPRDALDILRGHGFNFVRLRVWVNPSDGYCDLESTLRSARRAAEEGFGILIDFHYSDTWADPGQQSKPASWSATSGEALRDSVRLYTGSVMAALGEQGTPPDIVQVGNEVICGMLWDDGRVCGSYDTPQQWEALAGLMAAGILGVRDADTGDSVLVMVHIDRGGDNAGSRWFLDNLIASGIDFDLIGQSFYPWWHGTLSELEANLADLAERYGKGIVIAETAYPWTLGWHDDTHNTVGLPEHLHPGYPATVDGQRKFLADLMDLVSRVPDCRGLGVFYWAPEWIAAPSFGSAWENVALFDFSGEVLVSMEAFDSSYAGAEAPAGAGPALELNQPSPNPLRTATSMCFTQPLPGYARVGVYDLFGREVRDLTLDDAPPGPVSVVWDGTDRRGERVAAAFYIYRVWSGRSRTSGKIVVLD
jgi:arabinogalactan endo-1,4-beta-galactosidase